MRTVRFLAMLLISILALGLSVPATAKAEEAGVQIKPWAQIFADYNYNISGYKKWDSRYQDNDYNHVEFTQTWIGLDAQITPTVSARIVLDSERREVSKLETTTTAIPDPNDSTKTIDVVNKAEMKSSATGPYEVWLTYAWFRCQPSKYFAVDFGMIPGAITKLHNEYWRYRYLDDLALYKYGFAKQGDLGVGIDGELPAGFGGWRVDVVNGEGKRKEETDSGKAVEAQLHINPLPMIQAASGLHLAGYVKENRVSNHKPRETDNVWDAILSYQLAGDEAKTFGFSVNGEYGRKVQAFGTKEESPSAPPAKTVNQQEYSVWADAWVMTHYGLIARYDGFDPNTKNDKKTGAGYRDETQMLIAGLWWEPMKYLRLCPNYRRVSYTAKVANANGKQVAMQPDQMAYLSSEFKF